MAQVLKADCSAGDAYVELTGLDAYTTPWWITYQVGMPSSCATALNGSSEGRSAAFDYISDSPNFNNDTLTGQPEVNGVGPWDLWGNLASTYVTGAFSLDAWRTVQIHWDGTDITIRDVDNAADLNSYTTGWTPYRIRLGGTDSWGISGEVYYIKSVVIGSTAGGSELFSDGFSGGDLSAWTSTTGSVSLVADPGFTGGGGGGGGGTDTEGRVLIAFDDGPLVASPGWTRIDGATNGFPDGFVSGYDVSSGRQTLLSQTDTGTATVYINDHDSGGLFDPRNVSSPYFGKLDGKQILLQLYDPVAAAWEDQFRGWIDDITWTIDGSAVGADGNPINASIQIDCVDMFDILAGFGLTPGLAGVTPPSGGEDGVWYAEQHVDDRQIEILTDVGIDSSRYGSPSLGSGNVRTQPVKYDPDESALQGLRDAGDAEFPFIANIYIDRHGKYQFRGRYGRFDPDAVAAEPGSTWDFTRWAAGDGAALIADSTRAQLRTFAFGRNRSELINCAVSYPQNMPPSDMPTQVYADTTSITAYGKHDAPPMSDLLTADTGMTSGSADGKTECFKYAQLLVLNQKDPRENLTTLGFKAMRPDGTPRATQTWALLTKADISHIVNVAVGYPEGTGLSGASPDDDYYIEGRHLTVRPLNPTHDYVELDLDVSPAVWSMDLNNVFPTHTEATSGEFTSPSLTADFTYSE